MMYREHLVIIRHAGEDEYTTVLPLETSIEEARRLTDEDWRALDDRDKAKSEIYLSKMCVSENGNIIADGDEDYEAVTGMGLPTLNSHDVLYKPE